ncbi:MAG: hypothetical protein ABI175_04695, partial [Polyangiales bacterium]
APLKSAASLLAVVVCSAGFAACGAPQVEPVVASSSHEAAYAVTYPQDVDIVGNEFKDSQTNARKILSSFFEYPKKLKDPNGPWVAKIVDKADAAGKSAAYAERMHKVEASASFYGAEKKDIVGKVAGNANYAIKQKKCEVDVSGTIASSLDDAYGDQLEKRLRERNEAFTIIDRYREAMPKEDVPILEQQADDIAYASYVVNIELIETKLKLRRMIADAEDIPKTADAYIADEKAFQAEEGRSPADKKKSEDRVLEMEKAKALVSQSSERAKMLSGVMDKEITDIQKEYAEALTQLKDQLKPKK